jgi:hypothetical protein
MLTLFSVPKPFDDYIGRIQRRAVESWRALDVQVVLLGDERGVAEAARDLGVEHVGGLALTEHGTPRLDSAFALADGVARFPLRAFVNADIILGPGLLTAARAVSARAERFLIVGESFEPEHSRGPAAIDWFVFPAGLFGELPPFAIGRARFDNWLLWKARQVGIVVNATHTVHAIHQPHPYDHVAGGKREAYYGEEAAMNLELAGGKDHIYTLHDASHVLRRGKLRRYHPSLMRGRETLRKIAWKLKLHRIAKKLGLR